MWGSAAEEDGEMVEGRLSASDSGALTVPAPPTRPLASSFLRPAALLHKPPLLTGPHPSAVERKQTQQAAGEKKERKVVKETHNLVFSSASLRAQSSRLSVPPPCWPVGVLVTPAGWKNATAHPAHRLRFFFFFFKAITDCLPVLLTLGVLCASGNFIGLLITA